MWLKNYKRIEYTTYGMTLIISVINIAVEISIQWGIDFIRPVNKTQNIINSASSISWIQFINLGLILLVIGLKVKLGFIPNPKGFLEGENRDFTPSWYTKYGHIIIQTMIL